MEVSDSGFLRYYWEEISAVRIQFTFCHRASLVHVTSS